MQRPRPYPRFLLATLALTPTLLVAQDLDGSEPSSSLQAARELVAVHPGLHMHTVDGRPVGFSGAMVPAATPREAVARFWDEHVLAFGVEGLERRELRETVLGDGEQTVFAYDQTIDGIPVENTTIRLIARKTDHGAEVTLATAHVVANVPPVKPMLSIQQADESIGRSELATGLEHWTKADKVYLYRPWQAEFAEPRLCWKKQGWSLSGAHMVSYSFYVDAATGEVCHVHDEIDHLGPGGTVTGFSTPGDTPDSLANPPTLMAMPYLEIRIAGGAPDDFVHADADGNYFLDSGGANLTASLRSPYVYVEDHDFPGAVLSMTQRPTQPDFVFNPTPNEATTAQVNAFIVSNRVVDFYLQRHPSLESTFASNTVLVQTNAPGACHNLGGQDGLDRVYVYGSAGGCANAAYSSAITHEFTHYVHDLLQVWPGGSGGIAFAEGYADCVSFLLFDSPFMAHDMSCTPDDYTRNPVNHPVDYDNPVWIAPPATTCAVGQAASPHYWGQLLSGIWWDMKLELQAGPLGSVAGRERCIELFTAWTLATTGISSDPDLNPMNYSMVPFNLIEVLVLDDDNGNLADGTPNQTAIETAFAAHGITMSDVPSFEVFLRGDVNQDGAVDIGDAIELLDILFGGGGTSGPTPCDVMDANADGMVDIGDATYLLNYLFSGGPEPSYPFPVGDLFVTTSGCP